MRADFGLGVGFLLSFVVRSNLADCNFTMILFLISVTCASYDCSACGRLTRVEENFCLTGSRSKGLVSSDFAAWRFIMCVFLVHLVSASRLFVSFSATLNNVVCCFVVFVPFVVCLFSTRYFSSLVLGFRPLGVILLMTQSMPRVSFA